MLEWLSNCIGGSEMKATKSISMLPTEISKTTPGSVKGMNKRVFGPPKVGKQALVMSHTVKAPKMKTLKVPKAIKLV